ncbi:MAG: undecaprenyl-diphosphatase UppP [Candidatus Uhrbacteria bacterium]
MSIIDPLILGLIQGLTEFLPVSSSGHLLLAADFLGQTTNDVTFDAVIHLATLAAVIVALWTDIKKIAIGIFKKNQDGHLGWLIILATIPVLIVGFFFGDWLEETFRSPSVVAFSLAFWGIILWLVDAQTKKTAETEINKISFKKSFFIGLSQIIALIPGTSRSGITITTGLFSGLSREAAARFSFLLGIPSIAAAGGFSLLKIFLNNGDFDSLSLIVAFIAAFISGFAAIKFLLQIMKGLSYKWFAIYRIALAVVIILFVWL